MPATRLMPRCRPLPKQRRFTTGKRFSVLHFRGESMSSFTISDSITFTVTHARHLASKVSADLKRMQRFYGEPSDFSIAQYEEELIELLKAGYLGTLTVGYKKNGNWIKPTLRYTAKDLGDMQSADDDPGKIRPGADINSASFYSYLTYSAKW